MEVSGVNCCCCGQRRRQGKPEVMFMLFVRWQGGFGWMAIENKEDSGMEHRIQRKSAPPRDAKGATPRKQKPNPTEARPVANNPTEILRKRQRSLEGGSYSWGARSARVLVGFHR
jgi:hypothetical protein